MPEKDGAAGPRERRGILVVEDDDVVREMVVAVLAESGFDVLEARTAPAACETFDRDPERIHLLFTDMLLPGGNGRDLALRFRERRPDLRVIYTSGYASHALPEEMAPEPGSAFVAKPFRLRDLAARVREMLA